MLQTLREPPISIKLTFLMAGVSMSQESAVANSMKYLYVHGRITGISPDPPGGGAAIIQMMLDSNHDRDRRTATLQEKFNIVFFCPSFRQAWIGREDEVWVHLWLLTNFVDVSITIGGEKWIRPLRADPDAYDYAASGEVFHEPQTKERYLDVGFPISLHIGPAQDSKQPRHFSSDGVSIKVAQGNLFGDVELWDPDLRPRHL